MCGGGGNPFSVITDPIGDLFNGIGDVGKDIFSGIGDVGSAVGSGLSDFGNFIGDNWQYLPAAAAIAAAPFTGGSSLLLEPELMGAEAGAGMLDAFAPSIAEFGSSFTPAAMAAAEQGAAAGASSMIPLSVGEITTDAGQMLAGGNSVQGIQNYNMGLGDVMSDVSNNEAYAASQTMAPQSSVNALLPTEGATAAEIPGTGPYSSTGESGNGVMDFLKNNKTMALLGAGGLANYFGKSAQAGQTKDNLSDYLGQTTWTPQKASAYQSGIASNAAGTYGAAGARAKGTLAEQMSGLGRGGGSYGAGKNAIDENVLNQLASAKNQALTTTSTPSNLSAAPFMSQTNATADTLTGLGGMFGNMATTDASLEFLKRLGIFK
jgi:hypothetical protein